QAILRLDHVADRETRKHGAGLAFTVAGRSRQPVADRVGSDDEVLVGVERLARADQKIDAMMISSNRGRHQNRIILVLVQRPMRDVRNGKVLDDLPALELQITLLEQLVRRLVRSMCERDAAAKQ